MRPVVGLCALESRQEGVVDVDGVRRVLGAKFLAEYLHPRTHMAEPTAGRS